MSKISKDEGLLLLVADCHIADTSDSSFNEEIDSVSQSVNNLLLRTAIMKALKNVMFNDIDNSMVKPEKENEKSQRNLKYRIADLKALLPQNNVSPNDQNTSDSCTLTEAVNYIKKLQMECAQRQALTDKLNSTYSQCMNLALRMQHIKDVARTQIDRSTTSELKI